MPTHISTHMPTCQHKYQHTRANTHIPTHTYQHTRGNTHITSHTWQHTHSNTHVPTHMPTHMATQMPTHCAGADDGREPGGGARVAGPRGDQGGLLARPGEWQTTP